MNDPFAVLGLTPAATEREVRDARRRLAKALHPDVAGQVEREGDGPGDGPSMAAINAATEAALARLEARSRPEPAASQGDRHARGHHTVGHRDGPRWVEDRPSFTIEALPAEAFEALLVVAGWLGEVIDDDPPYVLEVAMAAPHDCWCRLELLPEAGSSAVTLSVEGVVPPRPVDPGAGVDGIRDAWIAGLNSLDWGKLDPGRDDQPRP